MRPIVLIVAVVTAVALVMWGISVSGGGSRFWATDEAPVGGHGEVTDAEREKLREVLEQIDRDNDRAE